MLLPTSPPQVPVKEYVGWNHLKPIAIFKLFYLFSSFCKLYWADSHVHGPSSPPLIFMWLAQEGVGLCWSSEEIWWFTGAALLSKTMVTLQSTWRWNKCSFLYSTSFLQLIVVLLFSSEISSLMGMCWSIKSVHIFSTREEFISFVQMVQMRSMFSVWQITRAWTQCKAGICTTCLIHRGHIEFPFFLWEWQRIFWREKEAPAARGWKTRNMTTYPILTLNSKLLVWKCKCISRILLINVLKHNVWQFFFLI